MGVEQRPFGTTKEGSAVTLFRICNEAGAFAEVLDYGATLRSVAVPDRAGALRDVCLGYDTVAEYEQNKGCVGAVIGRCANRIRGAGFHLGEKWFPLAANVGENHLHGGVRGFNRYVWDSRIEGDCVIFSRLSPDGEEGYPGNLRVEAAYSLSQDNCLRLVLRAVSDRDTVVNLTNHAYWNLEGHGAASVGGHLLTVEGDAYTESGPDNCPTGVIAPVAGTPLNFRTEKRLDTVWDSDFSQIRMQGGIDTNWALLGQGMRPAAQLYAPESGIALRLFTNQPGLQVYTANSLGPFAGKDGARYGVHQSVALEPQAFPDAVNQPAFPSAVVQAGVPYCHEIEYAFSRR